MLRCLGAVLATVLAYPIAWYLIHRFVLHSRFLYRSPLTAALWKRIHFDHHQDPHRMDVLFGSPLTTLPTILAILLPLGWLIGARRGGRPRRRPSAPGWSSPASTSSPTACSI